MIRVKFLMLIQAVDVTVRPRQNSRMRSRSFLLALTVLVSAIEAFAQETPNDYLNFIRTLAAELRKQDRPPANVDEWLARKSNLRSDLFRAWGGFPDKPAPLEPRKLGELQRDGYRIEKIIFQTIPGVWMTA